MRHYLIDFASTLGAGAHGPTAKYGFEFGLDFAATGKRALTLGVFEDPWRRLETPGGLGEVGFWENTEFDPGKFKPSIPNSAFANLTDRDGYWAAKIISAFTSHHLEAIVEEAEYRVPEAARHVVRMLEARRDKITRHFFDRVAPLDFFMVEGDEIEFHDLGVERGVYQFSETTYRARFAVVNPDRRAHRWTNWTSLARTALPLTGGAAAEKTSLADAERFPFLAWEVMVSRGDGWSEPVTVYTSRESNRIVAVDR